MAKKNLSTDAPVLGRRTVTAGELDNQSGPFRWDSHAVNPTTGKPHPFQAEKLASINASITRNGIQPIVLPARIVGDTVRVMAGRHRVHCVPPATLIELEIVEADDAKALSIACYSNAEGQGFSMMAALEQLQAIVRFLCAALTSQAARDAFRPKLELVKPRAQRAYTADLSKATANPYSAHARRGDAWTYRDVTAEQIASFGALSPKTAERLLRIMSGLHLAELQPSAVAGMTYEQAEKFAGIARATVRQRGDEPESPQAKKNLRTVAEALRKNLDITGAESVSEIAAKVNADEKIATSEKKKPEPRRNRSYGLRVVESLDELAKIFTENEDATVTTEENEQIYARCCALIDLVAGRIKDETETPDADDDEIAPDFTTDEKIAAENERLRSISA